MIQKKGSCYLAGTIHVRTVSEGKLNVPVDVALLEGVDRGHISVADWLLHMPVLLFYYIWMFILRHLKTDQDSAVQTLKLKNIKYETVDLTMKDLLGRHRGDIAFTIVWYSMIAYIPLCGMRVLVIAIVTLPIIFGYWVIVTQKDRDRVVVDRIAELTQRGMNVLVVRGKMHVKWITKQLIRRGIEYKIISTY